MPEHHDPTASERDPIIDELRTQRPLATPPESVRAAHRAALESAVDKAAARSASWRPRRRVIVAVAASVAIIAGVVVAANVADDKPDSDLVAGENDTADPSSEQPDGPTDEALTSAACGGPLPFEIPVGDDYSLPISGPAPGADAPSAEDQLVAHWTSGGESIEARWPADADSSVLATHRGTPDEDRIPPVQLVGADLWIELFGASKDSEASRSEGNRDGAGSDGTFTFAIAAYESDSSPQGVAGPGPIWGPEMCGAVQLTVRASDGSNVLPAAEQLYNYLVAPGGPLVPEVEERRLVTSRTEAGELEPVTPCDVPDGVDQLPTESTPVDGRGPFQTADEALSAHIDTRVITDEGPFGKPVTTPTVPTAGYAAISLPDGTIAYKFPDVVAYFIASPVDGGWSITRYMGPTC